MQGIRAKKSLGQNFLTDTDMLHKISHACPVEDMHIVEVGPGYGALTDFLVEQNPKSLTLVELDNDLIPLLQKKYTDPRITIEHKNVLDFHATSIPYSVIANIPYYITSPILFHFLSNTPTPPDNMVIMMQKEVGEKILAGKRKKPKENILSLSLGYACDSIDAITLVPKTAFYPIPKVDSIVLRFVLKKDRDLTYEKKLLTLWEASFTHPRKTLLANIRASTYSEETCKEILLSLGYSPSVRAEEIAHTDWPIIEKAL